MSVGLKQVSARSAAADPIRAQSCESWWSWVIAAASATASFVVIKPVEPSSITSPFDPTSVATTGIPASWARQQYQQHLPAALAGLG